MRIILLIIYIYTLLGIIIKIIIIIIKPQLSIYVKLCVDL